MTLGLERPDSQIAHVLRRDRHGPQPLAGPGFNVRWEKAKVGHVQFAAMFRDIGAQQPRTWGDQHDFGWGANLSFVFDVGRAAIPSWASSPTARASGATATTPSPTWTRRSRTHGDLKALPYFAGFLGYTHWWTEKWRSTITYGYVDLRTSSPWAPTAYHRTDYASLNAVYQFHKKMSLGMEVLYGYKQQQDLLKGDVWRLQFGIAYKLF